MIFRSWVVGRLGTEQRFTEINQSKSNQLPQTPLIFNALSLHLEVSDDVLMSKDGDDHPELFLVIWLGFLLEENKCK